MAWVESKEKPSGRGMIQHSSPSIGKEELRACQEVLESGYLASGPQTREFEGELADRYGRRYAVLTSSGFSALHLALLVLGVKAGDQVVLPSYCCTALLNAVNLIGAKAVIVDTPYLGIAMDGTKAIENSVNLVPQMFGVIQNLEGFDRKNLIEDGAMSLGPGALRQGRVAISSFYATKMMTTGQGGVLLTDEDDLAEEARDLIAYDNRPDYRLRFNYAPTDLGSALGRVQLGRLSEFLDRRQALAEIYDEAFKSKAPQILASEQGLSGLGPGLFRYWVRVKDPLGLAVQLKDREIEAKSPVYRPLHRYLGLDDVDFPYASDSQESILSLPFHPDLGDKDQEKVIESLLSLI